MLIPLRDENPRVIFPYVTYAIVALNTLVFLFQLGVGFNSIGGYELTLSYGLIPATATRTPDEAIVQTHEQHLSQQIRYPVHLDANPHNPLITLFTSMFMHGGFIHILMNMWFLWIFADNIEGVLGHFRFVFFYLLSGIGAGLTQILADITSTTPTVGASGAIAGVLGAYMITFPRAKVVAFLPFFFLYGITMRIPAVYYLGFWFLIQLTNGLSVIGLNTTGGVAWFAHIGGFTAGIILITALRMIKFERA